ncbi:MAG: winged helix-turn-helix domain-containing protein [Lentisphaerae bacterium]|nr:winged helix-turn-helix domain-containing protein [Lentisphaerota bacterium]
MKKRKKGKPVRKKKAVIADVEGMLIKHVRASGGISRIELSKAMNLSASTIGIYVERLLHEGILREGRKDFPARGRPRTFLHPNPRAGYFIGVDFHGEEILTVSVDAISRLSAGHAPRCIPGTPRPTCCANLNRP